MLSAFSLVVEEAGDFANYSAVVARLEGLREAIGRAAAPSDGSAVQMIGPSSDAVLRVERASVTPPGGGVTGGANGVTDDAEVATDTDTEGADDTLEVATSFAKDPGSTRAGSSQATETSPPSIARCQPRTAMSHQGCHPDAGRAIPFAPTITVGLAGGRRAESRPHGFAHSMRSLRTTSRERLTTPASTALTSERRGHRHKEGGERRRPLSSRPRPARGPR